MKTLKTLAIVGLLSLAPAFIACGDDHDHEHDHEHGHSHGGDAREAGSFDLNGMKVTIKQDGKVSGGELDFEIHGDGIASYTTTGFLGDADGKELTEVTKSHTEGDSGNEVHIDGLKVPKDHKGEMWFYLNASKDGKDAQNKVKVLAD